MEETSIAATVAGLADCISRLSFLADDSSGSVGTHLEEYSYLGLDTPVKRARPQPGFDLTYVKFTGEGNGDAGDQYIGLDRFGRVADQRWVSASDTGHPADRFQYGYDADSNPLYRDNKVNSAFGELFHANGSSGGYDGFNQLTQFCRGALSDTNSDGVPDTVSTASHSQSWGLDVMGNWTSLATDGSATLNSFNKQNQYTASAFSYDNSGPRPARGPRRGAGNFRRRETAVAVYWVSLADVNVVVSGPSVVVVPVPGRAGVRFVSTTVGSTRAIGWTEMSMPLPCPSAWLTVTLTKPTTWYWALLPSPRVAW
jgi:hypothetical protein